MITNSNNMEDKDGCHNNTILNTQILIIAHNVITKKNVVCYVKGCSREIIVLSVIYCSNAPLQRI